MLRNENVVDTCTPKNLLVLPKNVVTVGLDKGLNIVTRTRQPQARLLDEFLLKI